MRCQGTCRALAGAVKKVWRAEKALPDELAQFGLQWYLLRPHVGFKVARYVVSLNARTARSYGGLSGLYYTTYPRKG